jgi:hypothetical protein
MARKAAEGQVVSLHQHWLERVGIHPPILSNTKTRALVHSTRVLAPSFQIVYLRRGEDGVHLCDLGPAPFEVMIKLQCLSPHVPVQEHEVPQSEHDNNTATIHPILESYRLSHAQSE